jgi:Flp pilus assembly protein TadD
MNLGLLHAQLGRLDLAESAYRQATRLAPDFTPAAVNLADVLRLADRAAESESVLREALARHPQDAALRHALGLALVRAGRFGEALVELRRATQLDPKNARYTAVYRVAREEARATAAP